MSGNSLQNSACDLYLSLVCHETNPMNIKRPCTQGKCRNVTLPPNSTLTALTLCALQVRLGEQESLDAACLWFEERAQTLKRLSYYQERRLRRLGLIDDGKQAREPTTSRLFLFDSSLSTRRQYQHPHQQGFQAAIAPAGGIGPAALCFEQAWGGGGGTLLPYPSCLVLLPNAYLD